jgi:hypothetical protein
MFGNLASGHTAPINDVCFCIAGQEQGKYVASVGGAGHIQLAWVALTNALGSSHADDRTCILWDLYPAQTVTVDEGNTSQSMSMTPEAQPEPSSSSTREAPPPVAYPIPFAHPLNTVCSHPSNARNIMLSDSRGTLSVLNWMELEEEEQENAVTSKPRPEEISQIWRGHRVAEFIDPEYLGRNAQGVSTMWGGGASWKPSDPEIFGASYGSKWHIWSQKSLQGGKPIESGDAFPEGGHRFR